MLVPASASFLPVMRDVVGRIAHAAGFTFDGIEDITLAVDEAAGLLLETNPSSMTVAVEGQADEGLDVRIEASGGTGGWPPEGLHDDMRWQIIDALCERAWTLTPPGVFLSQPAH